MKIYVYLALAVLLITSAGVAAKSIHTAGYNKRDNEVQQEILEAQERARSEEEQKWRDTVAAAEGQIVIEEKIVEKIRVVEKEIPKVVKEIIIERPQCADLGPDFARVLNQQINASNSVPDTETTPGVVD